MLTKDQPLRWTVTVDPVTEPVTIHEVKRQLNLSPTDTAHDVHLAGKIISAREQFEHDTSLYLVKRTVTLQTRMLEEIQLPHRAVNAVTSITYYDASNVSQTLSSGIYQLDAARGQVKLAYDQTWPSTVDRWDAVTYTYQLGSHDNSTTVPGWCKSAILLLVANEFEQPDMMSPAYTQQQVAYERLITRFMRSTYP